MDQPLEVTELLPPAGEQSPLSDEQLSEYESALDDTLAGRWPAAIERLHHVPADDRVKDFLTMFIVAHNRTPPDDWTGVIPLTSK